MGLTSTQQKSFPEKSATNGHRGPDSMFHQKDWSVEDSEQLYQIRGWGEPYFSVNTAGRITVSPKGDRGGSLDLFELVQALQQRDIQLPLLIRFPEILEDRIERLNACFAKAIARYSYDGVYRGVFPIKCNQNRHLVEEMVQCGKVHHFGLEAGSKPELMISLAMLDTPGALLICNGYKDREFIDTAILARRLGQNVIIVLEQLEEVHLVIEASKKLGVEPVVGVRAKLTAKGEGRWGTSAGDYAKFGMTASEIIHTIEQLEAAGLLHCLQLLHFHVGSQISSISVLKEALREAGRFYVELAKLGADMKYLDVGGGLAVDYNGSKTNFHASKNYNMQNYANDVVAEVKDACTIGNVPVPTLISESGRAIASHQSVLIFDVLGSSDIPNDAPEDPGEDAPLTLRNLYDTYQSITAENYQEAYHDAEQFKEESVSRFNFGYLSLRDRASAERIYWACCRKITEIMQDKNHVPDDLKDLAQKMSSIYYANLSVFQSAPDSWAIDQLFPILPIHRLDEAPTQRATLADLTCDSDGKIDQFIDLKDVKGILELHALQAGEPYLLGMFLNGAYQETMGNLHNLFGDTNTVHIRLAPKGYAIEHVVRGDTMREVLAYVQYDADDLLEQLRTQSERALQEGKITLKESQLLLKNYEQSMRGYTYLTP
jgi:arginine decarboxylase